MIRERLSPLDILMVLICSGILAYQSDYPAIGLAIGLVWIIPFLLVKPSSYRRLPYRMDGKRMLYAFLAAFVVQMALHFVQLTIMGQREVTQLGVSQLVLTLPIFRATSSA